MKNPNLDLSKKLSAFFLMHAEVLLLKSFKGVLYYSTAITSDHISLLIQYLTRHGRDILGCPSVTGYLPRPRDGMALSLFCFQILINIISAASIIRGGRHKTCGLKRSPSNDICAHP
jgi:hypothetical protein